MRVEPTRPEWLEALVEGDDVFAERFGAEVVEGWVGFPESLPHALDAARRTPEDPWGSRLFFDDDGALVGFGGWKGAPRAGCVELGYAVAPPRQGRGIATNAVGVLIEQARAAGVRVVVAHTLAVESASTTVLRRHGFTVVAEITDLDDGALWRWERPA